MSTGGTPLGSQQKTHCTILLTIIQVVILKCLLAVSEQLAQGHAKVAARDFPRHELLQEKAVDIACMQALQQWGQLM